MNDLELLLVEALVCSLMQLAFVPWIFRSAFGGSVDGTQDAPRHAAFPVVALPSLAVVAASFLGVVSIDLLRGSVPLDGEIVKRAAGGVLLALFVAPLGLWLIWLRAQCSSCMHASRAPHIAVAIAMLASLGLSGGLALATAFHDLQGWTRHERLPELLNLAGRQMMLSQRVVALSLVAELSSLDDRKRTLWRLREALDQLTRVSTRVEELVERQGSIWVGDFRPLRVMLSHENQFRRALFQEASNAVAALEQGRKPDGKLALAADSFLVKMNAALLRLQWQSDFLASRARTTAGLLLVIEAGLIALLASIVSLPIIRLIKRQYGHERDARLKAMSMHGQLSAFIEHAPAAVAMLDRDLRFIAASQRWRKDYGAAEDTIVGQGFNELVKNAPAHWKETFARCLAGAVEVCNEQSLMRTNGSEQILRLEVRPWYTEDGAVGGLMVLTEDISERKAFERRLWRLAKFDPLTGLPNRVVFGEMLEARVGLVGEVFALGIMDLDGFKEINDALGHAAGDALLKGVGERLGSILGDSLVRLGGDEFAFILDGVGDLEAARPYIEAIYDVMATPISFDHDARRCGMSIGLTFCPSDGQSGGELMKNADLALYRAKSLGRNRCEAFTDDLRISLARREQLRRDVEEGLTRNEFSLVYQPIVSAEGMELKGFEALLRWAHPRFGLLSPGFFSEVFEDTKLAAAIGHKVQDLAVDQARRWHAAGHQFGKISINVASADFAQGCFGDRFGQLLERCDVDPSMVCIEVTEGMFLGPEASHVETALNKLHKLGVEIALDDFGTGFASLSHLKRFPVSCLKVDQSFVRDIETDASDISIVRSIIQLGAGLGLAVTAEGVENAAQLELLKELGCTYIQGYLVSRPLSESDASALLAARATNRQPEVDCTAAA